MELQDALKKLSNEIATKLGVANEKEVDPKPRMKEYQKHYRQFLEMARMLPGLQGGSISAEVTKLTVPQNFDLQNLFDEWFAREESDGAFLFQDHAYTQKLLGRWNVQYEGKLEAFSLLLDACHPLPRYLNLTVLVGFVFSFQGGQGASSLGDRPGGAIPRVYPSAMEADA
jgi:hypothetical protein